MSQNGTKIFGYMGNPRLRGDDNDARGDDNAG